MIWHKTKMTSAPMNPENSNSPRQLTGSAALAPLPCSQFPLRHDDLRALIAEYGEQNRETGGEDFCEPWWDAKRSCWCVACRYEDCGLRQYADGWEFGLDGKRWPTAREAYEHRNDRFNSASAMREDRATASPVTPSRRPSERPREV